MMEVGSRCAGMQAREAHARAPCTNRQAGAPVVRGVQHAAHGGEEKAQPRRQVGITWSDGG